MNATKERGGRERGIKLEEKRIFILKALQRKREKEERERKTHEKKTAITDELNLSIKFLTNITSITILVLRQTSKIKNKLPVIIIHLLTLMKLLNSKMEQRNQSRCKKMNEENSDKIYIHTLIY